MGVTELRKELRALRAEAIRPVSKLAKRDVIAELEALRGPAAVAEPRVVAVMPVTVTAPRKRAEPTQVIEAPKQVAKIKFKAPVPTKADAASPAPKLTRPAPGTPEMKAYMSALRARRSV